MNVASLRCLTAVDGGKTNATVLIADRRAAAVERWRGDLGRLARVHVNVQGQDDFEPATPLNKRTGSRRTSRSRELRARRAAG